MIKIISWHLEPTAKRIGKLIIQYHNLLIPCELVLFKKKNEEKLWIRMPETWFNHSQRTRHCYWINDIESQKFQQEVLSMMQSDYNFGLSQAKDIHAEYTVLRRQKKKPDQDLAS